MVNSYRSIIKAATTAVIESTRLMVSCAWLRHRSVSYIFSNCYYHEEELA